MAWIELHDTLPDHPKVIDLADLLRLDKDAVVGKLVRLWTWALNSREDGFLRAKDIATVADVMRFKGKPQRLIEALVKVQLLDQAEDGYTIHDWDEHVAMLMDRREEKRKQTADRVKRFRERKKQAGVTPCNALQERYETPESNACNARTVPNRTIPNDIDIMTDTISVSPAREEPELSTSYPQLGEQVEWAWINVMAEAPTEAQVKTITRHAVGMDISAVKYAIELACLYGAANPSAYAARVLNEWHAMGIVTEDAARAWREEASGL